MKKETPTFQYVIALTHRTNFLLVLIATNKSHENNMNECCDKKIKYRLQIVKLSL